MGDLQVGDTVEHCGSGRRGVIVALGVRWYGLPVALVEMFDPVRQMRRDHQIPRAALRKVEVNRNG